MWVVFALISASFLGVYDVFKKLSLTNNSVLPVLIISSLASLCIFLPLIIISSTTNVLNSSIFYVPKSDFQTHVQIFVKAIIVTGSWVLSFFALKNLPISIVTPIRATGPIWTLTGALFLFHERLTFTQWIGLSIVLFFFYLFSLAGKKEGIQFRKNKWILFIIAATLLGAASGLYDKYLIKNINRMQVQAWFTVYQLVVLLPFLFIFWYPKRKDEPIHFTWTIPMIGIMLSIADFAYFYALSIPGALISIISTVRRGSAIISFASGALLFKEKNIRHKALLLSGILLGIIIIYLGTQK